MTPAAIRRTLDPHDSRTYAFLLAVVLTVAVVAVLLVKVSPREASGPDAPGPATPGSVSLPPELPTTGVLIRCEVQPDGTLLVTQWIRSRRPVRTLVTSAHDSPLPPGEPQASGVRVETPDGVTLAVAPVVGSRPSMLVLASPAKLLKVSYVLSGVTDRYGSVTGRALAGTTFLDVDFEGEQGPTRVEVVGEQVLNLACAAPRPDGVPSPCGAPVGSGWSVTLPEESREHRVIAQLDLSRFALGGSSPPATAAVAVGPGSSR